MSFWSIFVESKTVREVFLITFIPIILMMLGMYIFRDKLQDTTGATGAGGTLIIGTDPSNPPFEFIKDGNVQGFDIDLVEIVADRIYRKVKIKQMKSSELIPALHSGEIDVLISAFSIDPEKSENMIFSVPYYTTSFNIIVRKEGGINSFNDLFENYRIGVQADSIMERFIKKFNKDNNNSIDIMPNASNADLIEKLKIGEIDAMVVERAQVSGFIKDEPNLISISMPETVTMSERQEYVIGFRKDFRFIKRINEKINKMQMDGEMDELLKKWKIH